MNPANTTKPKALHALQQAIERGHAAHAIVLHGPSLAALEQSAMQLACCLLETDKPEGHADCLDLRPSGKMRQILIGGNGREKPLSDTRALLKQMHQSPRQSNRRVAIIHEADRLNPMAANALLKTLEEPPGNGVFLLLSTRLDALLPTLQSRCLGIRIPSKTKTIEAPSWQQWLKDYQTWLTQARSEKSPLALLHAYGLIVRFENILKQLSEAQAENIPPEPSRSPEAQAAEQAGRQQHLRELLLEELMVHTRLCIPESMLPEAIGKLSLSFRHLEKSAEWTEANLQETAALEYFLLCTLRIWSRP